MNSDGVLWPPNRIPLSGSLGSSGLMLIAFNYEILIVDKEFSNAFMGEFVSYVVDDCASSGSLAIKSFSYEFRGGF